MIVNDRKIYYPLDFGKMIKDGKVYYDRKMRMTNYFYLDLRTGVRERPQEENNETRSEN